ncbi:MAG: transketolase [Phycisphaerales bacterium]|nr:transketolase [Phycisphaerales bacterium]
MASTAALHHKAVELGKLAVRMTTKSGSGHPSSALSLAHLITCLMYRTMRYNVADPWHPSADRLVLSEGHAVPIVYAALADLGATVGKSRAAASKLTHAELDQLRARDSVLDGHPNPAEGMPFFDAATGSLGMGLSVAAGLAAAARLDGSNRRVYCIIGDGEAREGQIWEAVDFIADHKLAHVCAIFNANAQGQAAPVSEQQSATTLAAKMRAAHWEVVELDGHDPDAILTALAKVGTTPRPLALIATTVKGWGCEPLLKGNWHGKPIPENELAAALAELDMTATRLGKAASLDGPPAAPPLGMGKRTEPEDVTWPAFDAAMAANGLATALEKGALSTRRAYGAALKVAGDLLPQVVALDGDVSNSTFSEVFGKAYPERFFECKIGEQNMISAGAGLAAGGYIPFANSFAKFISRAYDQIEMANISRANLKIVGSHAGISLAADGPSQMGLVDVAFFASYTTVRGDDRESPLLWFFHPADALTAYHCTRHMTTLRSMCYMRTHRPDVPLLYETSATFELGAWNVLNPGDDLTIIASGYMVHPAKQAVALLAKQNIRATLIDAWCLPVQPERLAEQIQRAGCRALVVEDNYGGGFGSIVAEIAARTGNLRVETLRCQRIPKSTRSPEEVLDYCGVGVGQIADHALAMLRRAR